MISEGVLQADKKLLRSRFQSKGVKTIKLAIVPLQDTTVTSLLFDIGDGRLFGEYNVVDVYIFDAADRKLEIEMLADNFSISGFPWIGDIQFSTTLKEAFESADYIILNPRMSRKKLPFKVAILDQAPFFSSMGANIEKYAKASVWIIVVTPSYTGHFCNIIKNELKRIPSHRITGLKRHIQVLATNLIAHKLKISAEQVKGVTVWGESIIDFHMATVDSKTLFQNSALLLRELSKNIAPKSAHSGPCTATGCYDDKLHNPKCRYCADMMEMKQRRMEKSTVEAEEVAKIPANFECSPKTATAQIDITKTAPVVKERQKTLKTLQDEITEKIVKYFKMRKAVNSDKINEIPGDELLEEFKRVCKVGCAEQRIYQAPGAGDGTDDIVPVSMIIDQHWLHKYLPKICLKASSKQGGALARSLSEHIRFLHDREKKPISVLFDADESYGFPRGLYLSALGVVDLGSDKIICFPSCEMSEGTQLKLFRQTVNMKKQCQLLDTNFWKYERKAFDRRRLPIFAKNENGIPDDWEIRKRRREGKINRKINSLYYSMKFERKERSTAVQTLSKLFAFYDEQKNKLRREYELEKITWERRRGRMTNEEKWKPRAMERLKKLDKDVKRMIEVFME